MALINGNPFANNLTGTNATDQMFGFGGGDVLHGLGGADVLSGGAGDDTLSGGAGADQLLGGADDDTASYLSSATGVIVNLATGTGALGDAQGDTLSGIENLEGSHFGDVLIGNAAMNWLYGRIGDDVLVGGGGADRIVGDQGSDTASYAGSAAVIVSLAQNKGEGGDAQGDVFFNVENLTGSSFGDTLIGTSGANTLSGGAGNDVLEGLAGADRLNGGAGSDFATYAGSSAGVSVDLASHGPMTGGEAQGDLLVSIENVIGSAFADQLSGDAAANVLNGGGQNDRLVGRAGDDRLIGGDGIDSLNGGSGADALFGGSGDDTVSFNGAGAGVTLSLLAGTGSGGDAAGDTYASINRVIGSSFGDTVTGDDQINDVLAGGGDDIVVGLGGDDYLSGEDGEDTLTGGNGDDLIRGGGAQDRLTGGGGADEFSFALATDSGKGAELRDIITDFSQDDGDRIRLDVLDAQSGADGNQSFSFIGASAFSAEGQVRFVQSGNDTLVQINTTGNAGADMEILLKGVIDLVATDVIL